MDAGRKIVLVLIAVAALVALVTAVQLVGREARWVDVLTLAAGSFAAGAGFRSLLPRRAGPRA